VCFYEGERASVIERGRQAGREGTGERAIEGK